MGLLRRTCDVLFEPRCVVCGGRGERCGLDICSHCAAELPRIECACIRCGVPLDAASVQAFVCGQCLRRPSAITSTVTAFEYAWPVHHLLHGLKYQRALSHARVLGTLLAERVRPIVEDAAPQCLCPVPLGRQRFAARGYNQALEIGRELEHELGVPLRTDLLERVRETLEQSGLGRAERRRNVRGAFRVAGSVRGAYVVVLDDVVTTGSTVRELARVLRRAGAHRIDVWAVARTRG